MTCECGCGATPPLAPYSHAARGWRKGEPIRFVHGHNGRGEMNASWRSDIVAKECECGCGEMAGRGKRFVHGHNGRAERSNWWNGGRAVNGAGYVLRRIGIGKYQYEHRLVMEEHLGRRLHTSEVIHHRDGNRANNRIENLALLSGQSEHAKIHAREPLSPKARAAIIAGSKRKRRRTLEKHYGARRRMLCSDCDQERMIVAWARTEEGAALSYCTRCLGETCPDDVLEAVAKGAGR